jgi:hypothetical protein
MARAIVRLSTNNDKGQRALRSQVRDLLTDAGFKSRGTAVWEADDKPIGELLKAVERATKILQREPSQFREGTLDHLWVYVDNPDQ